MDYAAATYDLYRDIQLRTKGEIYIGVLGPVRTGKSTFIKRFLEEMVLPGMPEGPEKNRLMDEMPQSSSGKTITTTEPKFIPGEAVELRLAEDVSVKIRLMDCVGYMAEGAGGYMEGGQERMVRTPWFDYEIPFGKAAEIGTDKVMKEHSTIGLVITSDGSIGNLPRESYVPGEEKTICDLKQCHKPFLVLLNCLNPNSEESGKLAKTLHEKYGVTVLPVNCEQIQKEDINRILENVLYEFPVSALEFYFPAWVDRLPSNHKWKQNLLREVQGMTERYETIRDVMECPPDLQTEGIRKCQTEKYKLCSGVVSVTVEVDETLYYGILTELVGQPVEDEQALIGILKEYVYMKREYSRFMEAVDEVKQTGYGIVMPGKEEIRLELPELIRQGNKYGVKMKAMSPSVHMIRANIETEIAPIVGTKQQAEDLMDYIRQADEQNGIWETNIFGKTVEQLVSDGMTAKIAGMGPESRQKLQDTMQKVVNDSTGGMVCIII